MHTRAFLAEKGVLDEIAPDLDACYAVGVSGSGVRYLTTSDSAVLQVIPGRGEFTANDYDYLKENVEASRRYYAENPDVLAADFSPGEDVGLDEWGNAVVQAQMAGASEVLFEDPADIAVLAAAARAELGHNRAGRLRELLVQGRDGRNARSSCPSPACRRTSASRSHIPMGSPENKPSPPANRSGPPGKGGRFCISRKRPT